MAGGWFEGGLHETDHIPSWCTSTPMAFCQLIPWEGLARRVKGKVLSMQSCGVCRGRAALQALPAYEVPHAHPGGYLFPAIWPVKLPEGEQHLNEIYVLRRQRDNLGCAAERGCCRIIIKLRCAGQM